MRYVWTAKICATTAASGVAYTVVLALRAYIYCDLTLQLPDLPFRCAHTDAQSDENSISANSLRSLGGDNYRQLVTSMNVIKLN